MVAALAYPRILGAVPPALAEGLPVSRNLFGPRVSRYGNSGSA